MTPTLPFHAKLNDLQPSLIRTIFDAAPKGAINMGLGMPDLPVPRAVIDAVRQDLNVGRAPYSPNAGWQGLRDKIAEMYQRWGRRGQDIGDWIEPSGVIVTAGAQEALFTALAAFVSAGDDVLVPNPGYPGYAMIVQTLGARAVPYTLEPTSDFRPSVKTISAAITNNTRAVILSSPANPTGVMADVYELRSICDLLQRLKIPWISDEVYDRYTYNEIFSSPSAFSTHGVVVGGLSKSVNMMGWRLGWVLTTAENADVLTRVHQSVCTCASTLSQAAASAALDGLMDRGDASTEIGENLAKFWDRRDRTLTGLQRLGLRHAPADGAFYVFVEVASVLERNNLDVDDVDLAWDLVRNHSLVIVPGSAFGSAGAGWIRLSYACDRVDEGIRRLAKGLGF